MPLLLTNDDGLGAEGLLALEKAASGFGTIRVIAPKEALSGCGHRVTTHAPIWWEPGPYEHHHALMGTPADCVRIALHEWGRDWDFRNDPRNPDPNPNLDPHPNPNRSTPKWGQGWDFRNDPRGTNARCYKTVHAML